MEPIQVNSLSDEGGRSEEAKEANKCQNRKSETVNSFGSCRHAEW